MNEEKKFSKPMLTFGRKPLGNLRIIILVLFIIFCIVLIIYHTYFESDITDISKTTDEYPQFSKSFSINLFQDQLDPLDLGLSEPGSRFNNTTIRLFNPSIICPQEDQCLIAFELEANNQTFLYFSESDDGETWTHPWGGQEEFTNAYNPQLEYATESKYRLFFKLNGEQYLSLSNNGTIWSTPEPWDYQLEAKSIYNLEGKIIAANRTGLWSSDFEAESHWRRLMPTGFLNSSIIKVDTYKFLILHENSTADFESLSLTTVYFKKPKKEETELNWGLFIFFAILGLILLSLMVQEVAHK
ncbi:hypothetical protein [[Eubacterium] cellulosolvens]